MKIIKPRRAQKGSLSTDSVYANPPRIADGGGYIGNAGSHIELNREMLGISAEFIGERKDGTSKSGSVVVYKKQKSLIP